MHFQALVRVDAVNLDGQTVAPLTWATGELIEDAGRGVHLRTPWHPGSTDGWPLAWGSQLDTTVHRGVYSNDLTEQHVAGYLAEYATKACETCVDCRGADYR